MSQDDLGRRGQLNPSDVDLQRRAKLFSFRRTVIPAKKKGSTTETASSSFDIAQSETIGGDHQDSVEMPSRNSALLHGDQPRRKISPSDEVSISDRDEYELAAAFRMMAATRSPDKENGNAFGGAFIREDSHAVALASAQAIEKRVVELIETIGKLVVSSYEPATFSSSNIEEPTVRSDPIFEYFCEKNVLSLLVEIAKEKRQSSEEGQRWATDTSYYHGVVWSPKVKAQVFATLASLVSIYRKPSMIYYLLSHNYVNDLIESMLPLRQWTDQALSKMMPSYVDMLQKTAVRLAEDPQLFPLLTRQQVGPDRVELDLDATVQVSFPLYSAVLETATGAFAQSDSIVYGTCLVVAVNIMQIEYEPIQIWVCNAGAQQRVLADHLCQGLVDRYLRILNLTTGPVVDGIRSNAIANQISGLKDHLSMIHEVFWSGVRGLDVRLCESLLQIVVTVLLKNLVPHRRRAFLTDVGQSDSDVIPEQEALAQASTIFIALLFSTLTYVPFQRMLAVALFHEQSSPLFASQRWMRDLDTSAETYVFMPLLSDIVTGENERETCPNLFRVEVIKGVSGEYGAWRATACACLFQSALTSEAMNDESQKLLQVVPTDIGSGSYQATPLEEAIANYLCRKHRPSQVTMGTLEHVGFLAVQMVQKVLLSCAKGGEKAREKMRIVLAASPVWKALVQARSYFANEAEKCQQITGVTDIFLDIIESAVQNRYTPRFDESGIASYRCPISQRGCALTNIGAEIMIRRMRSVTATEVESVRFFLSATLHFRALCKVIDRFCLSVQGHSLKTEKLPDLDLMEKADELVCTIGGLVNKPKTGTDIDLTGRMTFPFLPAIEPKDALESPSKRRVRSAREKLMLVLDPTDLFVVRRQPSGVDENRAVVLCSISLRTVIAAAEDGSWLHVAVRHEDVGYLIKNGNMALQLESSGSCLIVKQFLDRSRESLRMELMEKVGIFLKDAGASALNRSPPGSAEEKKTVD